MSRLFLNNNDEFGSIIEISDLEITTYYRKYGYFTKTENNNLSDLTDRADGSFSLTQYDANDYERDAIEAFLEKFTGYTITEETENEYAEIILKDKETAEAFIFYINMRKEDGDDTDVSDEQVFELEGNVFAENWLSEIGCDTGEVYKYWDGHNWKEMWLTSLYSDTDYTEVTDEYPGWEDKISIGNTDWIHGRRCVYYALPENDSNKKHRLLASDETNWQGEFEYYQILGIGSDEWVKAVFDVLVFSDIEEYFSDDIEEFLKSFDLKKGEKLIIEDGVLCFSYRKEYYHFSVDELTSDYIDFLRKGRDAIRDRRIEAITEHLAQNDYAGISALPLQRIFVERTDSLQAGNCEELTDELISKIKISEQIGGNFALRADKLLSYRDDNYSRRAILKAYRNHFINIA